MEIQGKVISGAHEGQYFMSLDVYRGQFREKIGFEPFPGTLNLEINEDDVNKIQQLKGQMKSVTGQGKFGDVKVLPALLNRKVEGALVFPEKTHHRPEILEFVASQNLRKLLQLQDGDQTILELK
ncbi:MAG: riboflavin kinase [Methanobacteriales archaeon Met13]